jgi:two-component system response regulator YesN
MYQVLLVDDEFLVRDAIKNNLNWEALGFELAGDCQNGKEAIEFLKAHAVDVVITDICMPYVDGLELSRHLYNHYPGTVIIIFSGFGEFDYAKKAIQYQVSDYLLKPVTPEELKQVLVRTREKLDENHREEKKLQRMEAASQEYMKNAMVIRSNMLSQMVSGTASADELRERLEAQGIIFTSRAYRTAILDIDIYSDIHEPSPEEKQESALMAFVVYNISDEIMRDSHAGLAYQETGNRTCLLFMTDAPKESGKAAMEICCRVQEKVKELMGLSISVGIGGWVGELAGLHRSFEQAETALSYRYFLGEGIRIDTETFRPGEYSRKGLYLNLAELETAVKINDRQQIRALLEAIEKEIVEQLPNRNEACACLQQVVQTVSGIREGIAGNTEEEREEREKLLVRILKRRRFQDAAALVEQYACDTALSLRKLNSTSGQKQAALALDYIQSHYSDPDLNLNSLCSYLGISTSHFSSVFKEATGQTFMEVLIRTRMDRARELLENTTMKNYEIAEKVGFADPHYFSISFKKATGKTPTEYAREMRKDE